ncbi:MAG: hypothetical protein WC213_00985 [Arenimonas sp.]|jgi:hypothetical protein
MKFRLACIAALSLALSSCSTTTETRPSPSIVTTPVPPRAMAKCPDCGRIEKIEVVQGVRATTRGGVVLGGVVGGVVSAPDKAAAPKPAGVSVTTYRLTVRMDDGRRVKIHQNVISANLRVGSVVRVANGRVMLLR